jgi:hypothetical protein
MASAIDFSNLTLNPEEARLSSEAVFEQVYNKGPLMDYHFIATGIQMQTQIPFYGLMGLVGKASSGCTPNEVSGVATSQKYWNPKLYDFRLPHCQNDVPQLFKMWKRAAKALDTWEEVDNEMVAFIESRGVDANMEALLRHTSFGDTAADTVVNGGNLTNGTDKGYFTLIDGLWKQIFTAVAATTVKRYTITENAAASKTAQLALGTTAALDAMRWLANNIDARAFTGGTLKYQMTRTMHSNWVDLLEDKSLANSVRVEIEEAKATKWSYRGYIIEIRYDWDRTIQTYFDQGTTYYLPHRMILTPVENIPIGTSDEESFSQMDSFYDKKDKKWYFDAAGMIDCKLLEEYKIAVAY